MAKKRGNGEGTIVKRADGRWMASLTLGRDPQTGVLKRASFYGTTRTEVAARLAEALRDRAHGVFVAPHKMTLSEWLHRWLTTYKQPEVRPSTYQSYEQQIRVRILPALGHILLRDLEPYHLQQFYNTLATRCAPRTVRYTHAVLRSALGLAEKHQQIPRNPTLLCTLPRDPRKDWPTLSPQQVRDTLFPLLRTERLHAAFIVAVFTGLRRGELLGLRWQDVDMQAMTLQVRQSASRLRVEGQAHKTAVVMQVPKTPQSRRTIPLPALCVQALRSHKARQAEERLLLGSAYTDLDLVFCRPDGTPLDPKWMNRTLARLLARAGLPRMRFHDLRHTFATLLMQLGESPKTVSQLLGHAGVQITLDWYTHPSQTVEERAIDRLAQALGGQE